MWLLQWLGEAVHENLLGSLKGNSLYVGKLNKITPTKFLFLEEQKSYFKTDMQIPGIMDKLKI